MTESSAVCTSNTSGKASRLARIVSAGRRSNPRTRLFLAWWLLFVILVAGGIHGSSIANAIEQWSPGSHYSGYLVPKITRHLLGLDSSALGKFALSTSRFVRVDEWLKNTPPALSQLSHSPRFPVVNTNIGDGQNMLAWMPNTPVWHITALARPATWGYFLLGPQRGLAWAWWLPLFGCFTALTLLLEVVLLGRYKLAAFGAFWFCASAYTVCWSLWPAYVVFFGALCCFALYHLVTTNKVWVMIVSAIVAGLSVPAEMMFLYPAWLVSVGYLFVLILAGLVIQHARVASTLRPPSQEVGGDAAGLRGRGTAPAGSQLYARLGGIGRDRAIALALFVGLAGGLCLAFVWACWPSFRIMAGTVYPGQRRSSGGGYGLSDWFKGFYNLHTCYDIVPGLENESEASSFFYVFPAPIAGLLLSARLRKSIGAVGWLVVFYLISMAFYAIVGVPQRLASMTLLSYVPSYRLDLGIGLGSIILCMIVLGRARAVFSGSNDSADSIKPALAAGAAVPIFLLSGIALTNRTFGTPSLSVVITVSIVAGLVSYFLMRGETRAFCGVLAVAVTSTAALFNPLSTELDQIHNSELARQIVNIDKGERGHPLWLCYGPGNTGALVTVLGRRSISGTQWPPQLRLWRDLDPPGRFDEQYNRDAWVNLVYQDSRETVTFANPNPHALEVRVSPDNPVLLARGARYVLATGEAVRQIDGCKYPLVYKSGDERFAIFAIGQETRGE